MLTWGGVSQVGRGDGKEVSLIAKYFYQQDDAGPEKHNQDHHQERNRVSHIERSAKFKMSLWHKHATIAPVEIKDA